VREGSWSGKPRKLRAGTSSRPFDPADELRDPAFVREAILQALSAGAYDDVVRIYRAHLRVLNRSRAAKAMGVSRQYVHKMLRSPNTPSLRTFAAFMRALGREAAVAR